ncbi:MAG: insulinase family protein [Myxococcales bacterium]|nr:MAG: insulinase family protein [Myxococcales bacterium]
MGACYAGPDRSVSPGWHGGQRRLPDRPMRRLCAMLGALALTAAPAVAQAQRLTAEKYRLDNGLEVILHEDHRTPVVSVNVWYHVGSKDEAAGKNGFAHLFEHVMFQGSKHVAEDTFFKYLQSAGASDTNGTTNTDRTNYFETLPANRLELALWLESDRMGFLLDHADQKTFENQREVVKNERRQNYENAPYGLVHQFVSAALFPPDHPYHRLTIGTPEDLDRASLDDVRSFFRTYYVPNNASLVVAGDIDVARTKDLIGRYFGPIVRRPDPPVKTTPAPVAPRGETRLKIEAEVELPRVTLSWVSPPMFAPGDAELDAVALLLDQGKSSRLQKRLVRELQIAQDVSVGQASSQLASTFDITVTLRPGKSPDEALKVIDEELAKLRATPPTADEVERARSQLLAHLVFANEKVSARANLLNHYNQLTGDPGFMEKDVARYRALSASSLQQAVVAHLAADRRVVAVVIPTPGAPRAGRLAGAP